MGRYILNTGRLYASRSILFQSIPLELIQNNKISSLTQTSAFKNYFSDWHKHHQTIILGRLEHKTTETKTILGFNLNTKFYVATWQSAAVQQLLRSKVMKETGVIQIHKTPSTAGANSALIILGHISPQHTTTLAASTWH